MPKKYHITVKPTPLEMNYVSKFVIVRGEPCINCGKCSRICIYEAHQRRADDPRKMAAPKTEVCKNCFRCIQECPRGALVKSLDRDFVNLGGDYWKPDIFLTLWRQAGDGKVPVSGAGYRGPFTGPGFDAMWTDMSEIVRPTRDGIHGREYISTSVELGRKLQRLAFDAEGRLTSEVPDTVDLPIPILFEPPISILGASMRVGIVKAAAALNTRVIVPATEISEDIAAHAQYIIPLVTPAQVERFADFIAQASIVEVAYAEGLLDIFPRVRAEIARHSRAVVAVRVPAGPGVENLVLELARSGAEIVHVVTDYRGREAGGPSPRYIKEVVRSVHLKLVEEKIRDTVTVIASGGIAMAEHVPKVMICGADLTAIDMPLLIAMGARLYELPERMIVLPDGLDAVPAETVAQRVVNLIGAWHSQLLEVMGAMGIREARRLRGETGRAIFFEEIDQETFGKLFKGRETTRA